MFAQGLPWIGLLRVASIEDPTRASALAAMLRNSDPVHLASHPATHADALRRVQTPVLAVVGEKDPSLSEAHLLIDTVPFGELVALPGEDHDSAVSSEAH